MNKKDVSIVIPIHNEEKLLLRTVSDLIKELNKNDITFELILVENGSTDRSPQIVKDLAQKFNNIKAFFLPLPSYGKAILKGYLSSKKEIVANFSIDWVEMSFLKKALRLLKTYDLVIASKNIPSSSDHRPKIRRLGGIIYHKLVRLLFFLPIADTHGIKAFNRKKLISIIKKCRGYSETFDTELVIRVNREGLKIKELPISVEEKRPTRVRIVLRGLKGLLQLIYLRILLHRTRVNKVSYYANKK